jgi:UDP-glucose 4-epimerase
MKILITGGAGFIGSHVADACIGLGHRVVVVDDLSTGSRENLNGAAEFVKMDIRDEGLSELFRRETFDVVIHHAAQMDVRKSVEDPVFDASVNILGSLNLLRNCTAHGVRKVIFASTGGAIYGEQDSFPAGEDHPLRPVSPYGVSKLSVEKYLSYFSVVHGLEHVALRYGNVYGPRQNPHGEAGVVAIFAGRMLAGEAPIINGDGMQTRDYVFVEDVVAANVLALGYRESGVFNIGTGIESSVNRLFGIIRGMAMPECPEKHGPAKRGEQLRSCLDASLARKRLGWKPAVALEEGLRRTVEFFRKKRDT